MIYKPNIAKKKLHQKGSENVIMILELLILFEFMLVHNTIRLEDPGHQRVYGICLPFYSGVLGGGIFFGEAKVGEITDSACLTVCFYLLSSRD